MKKKEKIALLAATTNLSAKEIAASCDTSEKYVLEVMNTVISDELMSDNITPLKYIDARRILGNKKRTLAERFGVTTRTLYNYEKKTGISDQYEDYLMAIDDVSLYTPTNDNKLTNLSVWDAYKILNSVLYRVGEIAQYGDVKAQAQLIIIEEAKKVLDDLKKIAR